ncbi:MAG: efflux RND transporter periplasmic adaptor subunit [Oscillospiraceae bacterium]|nr:efflux RND transporter periplasmic adaptor subunit [Oscillospiraceae bacterium]
MSKRTIILTVSIAIILIIALVIILVIQQKSKNTATVDQVVLKEATVGTQTIIKQFSSSLQVSSGLDEQIELHATYYFNKLLVDKSIYVKGGTKLLEYTNGTYLTAPYDLVVTNYSLPASGDMCTNSNYIEVQTTETCASSIQINEADMDYITLGEKVAVVINAFPDKTYTGYITDISDTATNSNFTATVTYMNDGNIKLGMSGYCTITLQEEKDVTAVPIEAINVRDDDTKYVEAVDSNGGTSEVNVETGIADSNYVEIKSGLTVGQTVQYVDVATGNPGVTTSSGTNANSGQQVINARQLTRALNNM